MMRKFILIILLFGTVNGFAQADKVVERMKQFHQLLVTKDGDIDNYIHDSLSYGHSNGWIENAKEFSRNLGGYIVYHSYKEDSITATATPKATYVRFIADVDVTMNGKRSSFRLKVLEVWIKKNKKWKLFARQAVKG